MVAILPAIGFAIDMIIKLIGVYNGLPDSDEAMKEHLRNLSNALDESKKKVAAVEILDV